MVLPLVPARALAVLPALQFATDGSCVIDVGFSSSALVAANYEQAEHSDE